MAKEKPQEGQEDHKIPWTKISTILGIIVAVISIGSGFFTVYSEIIDSRNEVAKSIAKNRTIIVDDLEIRRDNKKRQLELTEERLKLMKKTDPNYHDVRDDVFLLKEDIDDLNRLIEKAKK